MLGHHEQIERLQNVIDVGHQARSSILDELIDTSTPRRENVPGYGKNVTSVFERKIRRDECPALLGSFRDQYTQRETRNNAVARREVAALRIDTQRKFRYQCPLARLDNAPCQVVISGWIDDVQATSQYCQCTSTRIKRRGVRESINSQRQPTNHRHVAFRQFARKTFCYLPTIGTGLACADDGQRKLISLGQCTGYVEYRRWMINLF